MSSERALTRAEIEAKVAEWRITREKRIHADKQANLLKEQETELKFRIIHEMNAQKFEGIVLDGRITGVKEKTQPVVEDRPALVDFIYNNKAIHLLQFRLSAPAVKELEESGIEVPGVGTETLYDLFDRQA